MDYTNHCFRYRAAGQFYYEQETVNVTSDNARMVVNGEVYEILLIDDPMNMHDHLEIYLRFIGGQ